MDDFEKKIEQMLKIDKEFDNIILGVFKSLFLQGHGNTGDNFHADITKHNKYFENTDYFYKGPLEFFHLTSTQNLLSILNERSFRLYSLHNSDDPNEYRHAGKLLRLSDAEMDNRKQNLYSLSFCPITELTNENVWNLYGKNFSGAAIVFTIENDPKSWDNYHMSEVKYDMADEFDSYFQKKTEFEKQYSISADCDLSKLIAFHKEPHWKDEKEIRLTTYFPFQNYEEQLKFIKSEFRLTAGRNRVVHYIKLPLWVDNDSASVKSHNSEELSRIQKLPADFFSTRPKVKIKNILIGKNSRIEPEDYSRFRNELQEIMFLNYGYQPDIDLNLFG
jgi:hypothetical protein